MTSKNMGTKAKPKEKTGERRDAAKRRIKDLRKGNGGQSRKAIVCTGGAGSSGGEVGAGGWRRRPRSEVGKGNSGGGAEEEGGDGGNPGRGCVWVALVPN